MVKGITLYNWPTASLSQLMKDLSFGELSSPGRSHVKKHSICDKTGVPISNGQENREIIRYTWLGRVTSISHRHPIGMRSETDVERDSRMLMIDCSDNMLGQSPGTVREFNSTSTMKQLMTILVFGNGYTLSGLRPYNAEMAYDSRLARPMDRFSMLICRRFELLHKL